MEERNKIFSTALAYRNAGLDVIPDHPTKKYPVDFLDWQKRNFTEEELRDCIINRGWGIGIRNQEGLDFDNYGDPGAKEVFDNWKNLINAIFPGFVDRLLIEETQHGGFHVVWKCEVIERNQKLASRVATKEELRRNPGEKTITFIETRGLGGQLVVSPTPGYKLLQGDWYNLPHITPEERNVLFQCARSLDLIPTATEDFETSENNFEGSRPGDLFNKSGIDESLELLRAGGWTIVFARNHSFYLRRPGKDKGVSATFGYIAPGIFYNFSSNAAPFEPSKAYKPFAVFTLLKHNGDFSSAASELAKRYQIFPDLHDSLNSQLEWPKEIDEAAFCGIVGDIIRAIEPHSEADIAALLTNLLTALGSIIGDRPHIKVEGDRHTARLFIVLVGETSKGRKGTSWGQIKILLIPVDEDWANNLATGLSSGEGLIYIVRDQVVKNKTDRHGNTKEIVEDEGISDKRALIIESEFSSPLKVIKREGNTLSPVIRNAWDSGDLRTLTKNNPTRATGAHISIIGHITKDELLRHLDDTEYANGFGNRFLWILTKRSKVLPFGGKVDENLLSSLVSRLKTIVSFAKSVDEIGWSDKAKALWTKIYPELSEGRHGLVGALLGRAEAYVIRIACLYALLDSSKVIEPEHLKAALAVWQYNEDSVEYIFQTKVGDKIADEIYRLLLEKPDGLTKTQISDHFQRHKSSEELTKAIKFLSNLNLVYSKEGTIERKIEIWFANPISELRNKRKKRILDSFKKYEEELNSQNSRSQELLEEKNSDLPNIPDNLEILPLNELQRWNYELSEWNKNCSPLLRTSLQFEQMMEKQRQIVAEIDKKKGSNG